ncbi:hypothetical protein H6778_01655 [Candidatus Nomurabacteria bacterium]|nr:hypothetical protein [Candidatus Nomurabacteria bacterium]
MTKKRKRKRLPQVTCWCRAYDFSHRIGGGRCAGAHWAESYRVFLGATCTCCSSLREDQTCDVATGIEAIHVCEGYQDHLLTQAGPRLPIANEEAYFKELFDDD